MSTISARREMCRFLESHDAEVLAVIGRWGVGKTHGWRAALADAVAARRYTRNRYAYVSTFGLRSIDALKAAIVQATVRLDSPSLEPSIQSFASLLRSSDYFGAAEMSGRRGLKIIQTLISMVPMVGKVSDLVLPGAALFIRNQIVCIDDIERAGAGLDVADILGLASSLRDEKNCKVVLLLNEEGLGSDRGDFRTYLEKAVDQAIHYVPTPAEAAETGLDIDNDVDKALAEAIAKLGITNIRVIRRIRRFLGLVQPELSDLHPEVLREAICGLALLGWTVFEPTLAPALDHVLDRNEFTDVLSKAEPTPQEVAWNAVLSNFGFRYINDLDRALLAGLQAGAFEPGVVRREAEKLDAEFRNVELRAARQRPWDIFRAGFGNDEADFKAAIVETMEAHGAALGPAEADGFIKTLRALGEETVADGMVDRYLEQNDDKERRFFDLSRHHLTEACDPRLAQGFARKLAEKPLERDPRTILLAVDREDAWNAEEIDFLASLSVDDYARLFRDTTGKEGHAVIRSALQFRRIMGGAEAYKAISAKALAALETIGAENRLNAMRVRAYVGSGLGAAWKAPADRADDSDV